MTSLRHRPASQLLIAATVLVVVGCCLLRGATERVDVVAQAGFPDRFVPLAEVADQPDVEPLPSIAPLPSVSNHEEQPKSAVGDNSGQKKDVSNWGQLLYEGPIRVLQPPLLQLPAGKDQKTVAGTVGTSSSATSAIVSNLRPAAVMIDSTDGPPLLPPDPAPAAHTSLARPAAVEHQLQFRAEARDVSPATDSGPGTRFTLPTTSLSRPNAVPANTALPLREPAFAAPPVLAPARPPQTPDINRASFFKLAEQPQPGEHFHQPPPCIDPRAGAVPADVADFKPDACFDITHDPAAALDVYAGKPCQPTQRPWLELGRRWYDKGPLPASQSWFGFHNPDQFQFILAGDQRIAYASNTQQDDSTSLIAAQLNLDFDLRLTSTERFHWFIQPLTQGARNSRWLLDEDRFDSELNADFLFGYFEGDLGAMAGGWRGQTLPHDLPFSVGVMPLVVQNGVWMEDAILGLAATLPAQNSPRLGVSNFDITLLAGYDQLDSPAFEGDDNAAKIYAVLAFIEAWGGYVEADYAFLEDRDAARDRSYHNAAIGYTRRVGLLSNSTRVIANAGQSTAGGPNTADGVLLLSENSLITSLPYSCVPYLNLFAGFDRPQSAARQAAAGGVLRNTGILFETDNLTGYPTLDATANETFGFAAGLNLLAPDFSHQLIIEAAWLGTMGDDATRTARGNQCGVGARYQLPLSHRVLLRMDAMAGFLESDADVHGARIELRRKF